MEADSSRPVRASLHGTTQVLAEVENRRSYRSSQAECPSDLAGVQALGFDVACPGQGIADFVTPWQKCHIIDGRRQPLEALYGRREIGVPSSGRLDELSGKPQVWSAEQRHAADHGLERERGYALGDFSAKIYSVNFGA